MQRVTMQLENDRRLLKFNSYEEYLDSMVTCTDLVNFRSALQARTIAELGYRSSIDTLTREQFMKRWTACKNFFRSIIALDENIISDVATSKKSNVVRALASREHRNRIGKLATIIFLRMKTEQGFEISAYIDYADRISNENWLPIFEGKKKIKPRMYDLSYFHWKEDRIRQNNSLNFKVLIDPEGLLFQCWHDRKVVYVDPKKRQPYHTTRTIIPTDEYEQVVLYDHLIRRYC